MAVLDDLLPAAVAEGALTAHYQPLLDLRTDRIVGAEALARWNHPELGEIPPREFIPVAERTGLIEDLGLHMLRLAWNASARWHTAGHAVGVSVNVSALQLSTRVLDDAVAQIVADGPDDARRLTLEITESQLFEDLDTAAARLRELRAMGAHISIDDFGTGHSSLQRIEDLPVTEIKLDLSLVQNPSSAGEGALTSITRYAQERGIELVAEGVETEQHLDRVRELGCDRAQGYLFGRPTTEDLFRTLLVDGLPAH